MVLLLAGLACVAGTLWVSATRTLRGVAVDATLLRRERRTEKHPGLDDVVLWHLSDGATHQVRQVTDVLDERVPRGAHLRKARFDAALEVDGVRTDLPSSDDFDGARRAAPLSVLALLLVAAGARRRQGRR